VKASGTTYEVAMVILDKARFAGVAKLGIDRRAQLLVN
jgi:hypothetical protein